MKKILGLAILVGAALAGAFWLWPGLRGNAQSIDPSCQTSAAPATLTGSDLQAASQTLNGIVWDSTGAKLTLKKHAGQFTNTTLGITSKIFAGCAADFDSDGWTDFVATGAGLFDQIKIYRNTTFNNPPPVDWTNP